MRLRRSADASDRGSGSILAIGIISASVVLIGMTAPLYIGTIAKHRAAAAADSAALAAADVASGLIPGYPCATADLLSIRNGAELVDCSISGLVVSVTVQVDSALGKTRVRAKAGPPGQ